MTRFRIGTRGSELAQRQTQLVIESLQRLNPALDFELVVIRTDGDLHPDRAIGEGWPIGSFTSALELALLHHRIDLAVHSAKDLPTRETPRLSIGAFPLRDSPHDVLITSRPVDLCRLPDSFRIGTSSPRRAAQLRRLANLVIVPIRGNVTTRLAKVGCDGLDGVVLAAAGLRRLALQPENAIDLPLDRFLPAPGQGALAVQVRSDEPAAMEVAAMINHRQTALAVETERAFLSHAGAGCLTPLAALATVDDGVITLCGQLFKNDGLTMAEGQTRGADPQDVGRQLALTLRNELDRRR